MLLISTLLERNLSVKIRVETTGGCGSECLPRVVRRMLRENTGLKRVGAGVVSRFQPACTCLSRRFQPPAGVAANARPGVVCGMLRENAGLKHGSARQTQTIEVDGGISLSHDLSPIEAADWLGSLPAWGRVAL